MCMYSGVQKYIYIFVFFTCIYNFSVHFYICKRIKYDVNSCSFCREFERSTKSNMQNQLKVASALSSVFNEVI